MSKLQLNKRKKLIEVGYKGKFDLSSLIEACGDVYYFDLCRISFGPDGETKGWIATTDKNRDKKCEKCSQSVKSDSIKAEGETPEEAVSELWLKLRE